MSRSRLTIVRVSIAIIVHSALLPIASLAARQPAPVQAPAPATATATAQASAPAPDVTLDAPMRAEAIDGALKALKTAYVFPDVAEKMDKAIRARQQRGEYDTVTSGRAFAELLTSHLREVSETGDKHLKVVFIPPTPPGTPGKPVVPPPPGPPPSSGPGDALTLEERQRLTDSRRNFEFSRVERLAGNIGYLDLRAFLPPHIAGETATAAMQFLSSADAVIFDLRKNNGGDPAMVAFLTTYLFSHRVHLNDFYTRVSNETRQSFTLPFVAGRRLTEADVYILTSASTVSGAEEFTYNLKHLKRATVIGETTAGAAHTVRGTRINSRFAIMVPEGRPINPVTKSNWEGVGIEPDVKVPAGDALKVAHLIALEKQQQALPANSAFLQQEIATALESLRKEIGPAAASLGTATAAAAVPAIPASKASDDFESGTLTNWRTDQRGSGGWFTYDSGKKSPSPAHNDMSLPFDVSDPPQGKFAAVSEQNGPGRFLLYRDITLDGRYRLHLTSFYRNHGMFSGATASSRNRINDEQQFRIDLVSPAAPIDSVDPGHVLATLFQARPGDPNRRPPTELSLDLSKWEGRTVRLRFAVAENMAPLRAGVDNIRFERIQP